MAVNNYNMDETISDMEMKRLMLDVKVETQLTLQLLVQKGLVTREEVAEMREKVKTSPKYAPLYQALDMIENKASYYKNNPEQHLKDLFQAKMDGKIR